GDGQIGGADAVDAGAHLDEHRADVDDLGFTSGVGDGGCAMCQGRGHDEVLRRSDGGEFEDDLRALQTAGGFGDEVPVIEVDLGAEGLEAGLVHIETAGADGV